MTRKVETTLSLILIATGVIEILGSVFMTFFNTDPIYGVAKWVFGYKIKGGDGIFLFILRMLSIIILMYFAVKIALAFLTVTIYFFHFIHSVLSDLNLFVDADLKSGHKIQVGGSGKIEKPDSEDFLFSSALTRCITYHRELRIIEVIANKAYHTVARFAECLAMVLIVLTLNGTIRLFGAFPLFLYLPMPGYSVLITTLMFLVLPVLSGIHDFSSRFLLVNDFW